MKELSTDIEFEGTRDEVWEVLADLAAYPTWNPFLPEIEGELRVGARLRVRFQPVDERGMTIRPTVRAVEPGREVRWLGHLLVPGIFDGEHRFLLNDSIRNDGFGNLYLYDSTTKEATKLNPMNGECCYRDARWSPDGKYILFVYQKSGEAAIELYFMPLEGSENGQSLSAIELPTGFFPTSREKPQPALRPAQ